MDLQRFMDLAREKWQFNAETYPELNGAWLEAVRDFAIRHVILHQMKSLGKIAAKCELADHGDDSRLSVNLDVEEAAVKMLVNAVRLVDLVGFMPEALDRRIEDWAGGGVRYVQRNEPRTGEPLYHPVRE